EPSDVQRPDGVPLFPQSEAASSGAPPKESRRRDRPVFTITEGAVQDAAQASIGRPLTLDEIRAVATGLARSTAWSRAVQRVILSGLMSGAIQSETWNQAPQAASPEPPEVNPAPPPTEREPAATNYLVHYTLWGITLETAPGAQEAAQGLADLLNR